MNNRTGQDGLMTSYLLGELAEEEQLEELAAVRWYEVKM